MRHSLPDDLDTGQVERLIDLWIFSERNRRILKRRVLDKICFEPLSEEVDMSPHQVKRIVYHGMEILIKHWPTR